MSDDSGSAFPSVQSHEEFDDSSGRYRTVLYSDGGMSLRDYFAGQALPMAWQMELDAPTGPYKENMEPSFAGAATRAYYLADAMLKARDQ